MQKQYQGSSYFNSKSPSSSKRYFDTNDAFHAILSWRDHPKTRLFGPKEDFLISLKTQKRNGFCRQNVKFGKVREEGEGTPICFYVIHLLNDAHYKRSQKSF